MKSWGWYPNLVSYGKEFGMSPNQVLKENFWEFLAFVVFQAEQGKALEG